MIAIFNEVFFAAIAAEDRFGFIGISFLFFFWACCRDPGSRRGPWSWWHHSSRSGEASWQ
jgi:hypothetical protein